MHLRSTLLAILPLMPYLATANFWCNGVDSENICPVGDAMVPINQYACGLIINAGRLGDISAPSPSETPNVACAGQPNPLTGKPWPATAAGSGTGSGSGSGSPAVVSPPASSSTTTTHVPAAAAVSPTSTSAKYARPFGTGTAGAARASGTGTGSSHVGASGSGSSSNHNTGNSGNTGNKDPVTVQHTTDTTRIGTTNAGVVYTCHAAAGYTVQSNDNIILNCTIGAAGP